MKFKKIQAGKHQLSIYNQLNRIDYIVCREKGQWVNYEYQNGILDNNEVYQTLKDAKKSIHEFIENWNFKCECYDDDLYLWKQKML